MVLIDTTQSEGTVETQLAKAAAKYLADDSFAELKITDEPSFDKIASYSTAKQRFDKEVEETFKQKGIFILSGVLIILAFWFSFMCQEEFKYSIAGMATSILAVGLIGYIVLKSILEEVKKSNI